VCVRQNASLRNNFSPQASVEPPGDIVTVHCANRQLDGLLALLDEYGIGSTAGTALVSSEPNSLVSPTVAAVLTTDTSESSWEEIEFLLTKESHMTGSGTAVMAIAGFCAAAGVASGSLHVVIAAMVIAPGFEPFIRVALAAFGRWVLEAALVFLTAAAIFSWRTRTRRSRWL
jgi:hypothetical protein